LFPLAGRSICALAAKQRRNKTANRFSFFMNVSFSVSLL
jgi:hypothetical protein